MIVIFVLFLQFEKQSFSKKDRLMFLLPSPSGAINGNKKTYVCPRIFSAQVVLQYLFKMVILGKVRSADTFYCNSILMPRWLKQSENGQAWNYEGLERPTCVCTGVDDRGRRSTRERCTMIFGTGSLIGSQGSQITPGWLAKGSQRNFCCSISSTGITSIGHQGQLFTWVMSMNLSSSWFTGMHLTNCAIVPAPKGPVWNDIDSVNYGCFLIHMRKCC